MDYKLELFSSNIKSLISIYHDSNEIRLKKITELEKKLSIEEDSFDDFYHYSFHFEWLILQSLFVSGFSYFESFMRLTALSIEKSEPKIKLSDIRGNGDIDTYRKYINLIGGINFASSDRKEWQTINEFRIIRNCLTHENGKVSKKTNKAKEHNIYFGGGETFIRIQNISFLEDFCETSIKYMESIANEMS